MAEKASVRWVILLGSCGLYYLLAYHIPRHETPELFILFSFLFGLYYVLVRDPGKLDLQFWLIAALVWRLVYLFSVPAMSDDIFRFLWDGRMLANGLNPFEYLPEQVLGKYPGLDEQLYGLLNSRGRPTIYPPLSQLVFYLSALISPDSILGSIVTMRTILLFGEAGTVFLMLWLLKAKGLSRNLVLLYALNPLVIMEITGNLHFEGLMIMFMLLAIALLFRDRPLLSAVSWGLAVAVKLIPLIFLPLFIWRHGWKRAMVYSSVALITAGLLFFPLLSPQFMDTMRDAVGLYFVKFEFNASLYYLFREYGYYLNGWNMIAIIGPRLAAATFILICVFAWWDHRNRFSLYSSMAWVLLIYLSLAMIVHPWYILTAVAFSVFTRWRWPLLWSGLILLSYEGYTVSGYVENYWLIALEYVALAVFITYEIRKSRYAAG